VTLVTDAVQAWIITIGRFNSSDYCQYLPVARHVKLDFMLDIFENKLLADIFYLFENLLNTLLNFGIRFIADVEHSFSINNTIQ
jgi:hypothetical protein